MKSSMKISIVVVGISLSGCSGVSDLKLLVDSYCDEMRGKTKPSRQSVLVRSDKEKFVYFQRRWKEKGC